MDRRETNALVQIDDQPLTRAREILLRSGHRVRQIQPAGSGSLHHLLIVELEDGGLQLMRLARSQDLEHTRVSLRAEAEAARRAHGIVPVAYPMLLVPDELRPEASLSPILPGVRAIDLRAKAPYDPGIGLLCQMLGRTLATLHTIRRPLGEPSYIGGSGRPLDERGDRLLHGDAHLGNLMVEVIPRKGFHVSGLIDWSFCHWGPPEADLVEMAICEAEPRPRLGQLFLKAYVDNGGEKPRREVFHEALAQELERRLHSHAQAYDPVARDVWTRWSRALQPRNVDPLRIFAPGRLPGRDLV